MPERSSQTPRLPTLLSWPHPHNRAGQTRLNRRQPLDQEERGRHGAALAGSSLTAPQDPERGRTTWPSSSAPGVHPGDRRAGPRELFTLAGSQRLGGGSKPGVRLQDRQRGPSAQRSITRPSGGWGPDPICGAAGLRTCRPVKGTGRGEANAAVRLCSQEARRHPAQAGGGRGWAPGCRRAGVALGFAGERCVVTAALQGGCASGGRAVTSVWSGRLV